MGGEVKLVLRLPAELHERIKHLAEQDRRSLNGQILYILDQYAAKRKKFSTETAALLAELLERILTEADPLHVLTAVSTPEEHGDAAQTTMAPGRRNNRDDTTVPPARRVVQVVRGG